MSVTRPYQLVILDEQGSHLLVDRGALPEVNIPTSQRAAPLVIEALRSGYSCDALCLFRTVDRKRIVMECLNPGPRLEWAAVGVADDSVKPTLEEARTKEGPFARPGWIKNLREWAGLTGPSEQYTGDAFFSLLRFSSGDQALWFKAVGEPNLREPAVTIALAERCPDYVPCVVATKPEWHGWLMREEQGLLLEDSTQFESWLATVTAIARFQLDLAGDDAYLLDIGCADWRMETILERLDSFLDAAVDLMKRQTKTPPTPLNPSELMELRCQLWEICDRQRRLRLPNSLVNGDIGPHNVILSSRGPVFLDWAEAYVAQPFISFAQLMAHLQKDHPQHTGWIGRLEQSYSAIWESHFEPCRVREALQLAPALAVLLNAMRIDLREGDDDKDKYARSLIRRIKREVEILSAMEVA